MQLDRSLTNGTPPPVVESSDHTKLREMAKVPPDGALKVLVAYIHPHGDLRKVFDQIVTVAGRAFRTKEVIWQTPGVLHAKMRSLHLGFSPTMAWTSGNRHWTAAELQRDSGSNDTHDWALVGEQKRGMGIFVALFLVVPYRVGACRHPGLGDGSCRVLVALGGACCPTRQAEMEPDGCCAQLLQWKDAWWRRTSRREHRQRRNDQPPQPWPQALGEEAVGRYRAGQSGDAVTEVPWQYRAQDRTAWTYLEQSFTSCFLRRQETGLAEVPARRHMLQQWS